MTKETGGCPQTPQRTEELYEEVRFQDQPALFTSLRVKAASIPEGLHRYEIRHEGGEPCQIARGILVDHYGTLLTSDPIQLPADGYLAISPEDLVFSGRGTGHAGGFPAQAPGHRQGCDGTVHRKAGGSTAVFLLVRRPGRSKRLYRPHERRF